MTVHMVRRLHDSICVCGSYMTLHVCGEAT